MWAFGRAVLTGGLRKTVGLRDTMITMSPTTDKGLLINAICPHAAAMLIRGEKLKIRRKDRIRKKTSAMSREYQFVIVAVARRPKAIAVIVITVVTGVATYAKT